MLEAFLAARHAQRIRVESFNDVLDSLVTLHLPLRTSKAERAVIAAGRALARGAHHAAWLNTCLTRSMTAAALLKRSTDPVLAIGFRPSRGESPVNGHAWLIVAGQRYDPTVSEELANRPYTKVLEFHMTRRGSSNPRPSTLAEPTGHLDADASGTPGREAISDE